ncbi:MAG TPA: histidinol dehydrogenase [Phycisphaerae bacterium]|nr:histidinol dehydrogenase [Phycisphaerae bacterium]
MIRRIDARTDQGRAALEVLRSSLSIEHGMVSGDAAAADAERSVRKILEDVRRRGDAALCEWTNRFDGSSLAPENLRVPEETIEAAYASMPKEFVEAAVRVREAVRRFQQHILLRDPKPLKRKGRRLSLLYRPMERVGVFVPGGKAFYPSTLLMVAVPALSAGVPHVAVASPPTANGDIHPAVLATCRICGLAEVYRIGGTPAIAAFAYGTETVPAVEKIAGPGNLYVQLAKRMVYGRVDIDAFAGPSEVVVLADASADATLVAADMLSQAEHDPGSAVLVTPDEALANRVSEELERQVVALDRAEATRRSLEKYSAVVLVADLDEGARVVNELAPEHLQILTADPRAALRDIRSAGAIFLGPYTPVAVGDYVAGPSHALPTGGTARWASGLTANSFLRSMSVIEYDKRALAADADDIQRLAETEGLTAHAESVRKRLE